MYGLKTQLCVKGWSGANNPSAKMSLDSMLSLVKNTMFLGLLLKSKKNISDKVFGNEGPGIWAKKTILAMALQWPRILSLESPTLLGSLFFCIRILDQMSWAS